MKLSQSYQGRDILKVPAHTSSTWEFKLATGLTVLQCLAGMGAILWYWKTLPPAVPLWYSTPWGMDRLAPPGYLFLPLTASVGIYALNVWIAGYFGGSHTMFARVLLLTTSLVSLLSMVLVIRIVLLVT